MNRYAGMLLLMAVVPCVAAAGETRASFLVSATVLARASLESVSQPTTLSVSPEDVARGYLDVTAAYRVSSNDPSGYMVRLAPRTGSRALWKSAASRLRSSSLTSRSK